MLLRRSSGQPWFAFSLTGEPLKMSVCYSCGRPVSDEEAYAKIRVAGAVYLVCCPMCMTAVEAGDIQRQMVTTAVDDPLMRVSVEYVPALLVGGDYFCVRVPNAANRHLVVSDISGHGVTSSLVSARLAAEIDGFTSADASPVELARALNSWMRSHLRDGTAYLTMFHAVIDFPNRELTYLGCGHPPQLLWSGEGVGFRKLAPQTFPVGLFDDAALDGAVPTTVHFDAGDVLFLFSDGLTDMLLGDGTELGLEGLEARLRPPPGLPESWSKLVEEIARRSRPPDEDDILAAMIELLPSNERRTAA